MSGRRAKISDDPIEESDSWEGDPHPRKQPRFFGHRPAIAALLGAAEKGRLHHAWLLHGPKGIGKATLAWRFARTLMQHGLKGLHDGFSSTTIGPVAHLVENLAHPDVLSVRRPYDQAAKRLKSEVPVEAIRELTAFLGQHASAGGYRIAIVDAADDMSTAAENALLKTLEEPPGRSILFLIAHQPGRLLPTTRSRCRSLALRPLARPDFDDVLATLDPAPAPESFARLFLAGGGSPGRALALSAAGSDGYLERLAALIALAPGLPLSRVYSLLEEAPRGQAAARLDAILDAMASVLQQIIHVRAGSSGEDALSSFAAHAPALARLSARGTLERWLTLWEKLQAARQRAEALNLDKRHLIVSAFVGIDAAAA